MMRMGLLGALAAAALGGFGNTAEAAEARPVKIGIVTFLSGQAAGPFGIPARNGADVFLAEVNAGKIPAPYAAVGFGGREIEYVLIDEAGGTTKQVSEYRNLVEQQGVDLVVGYISSGDCLAVAPVAEELKKFTVLFDCATQRIFEDESYKYVFRTASHATMDNVAAALYLKETKPGFKKYAGINQNYAYGQDAWRDFDAAVKALQPGAEATTSQMPKLGAGQYNAEISALLSGSPEIIHSSMWGGDLDGLILQGAPRDLFKTATVVFTAGEPAVERQGAQMADGTIIGARGPNGVFAPDNALNRWFRAAYQAKYGNAPIYAAYHMVQSLMAVKLAYEKAQGGDPAKTPTSEELAAALTGLTFEAPSGKVEMALGKGHQAVQGTVLGSIKQVDGKPTLVNIRQFSPWEVNPPEGMKSADWIASGLNAKPN